MSAQAACGSVDLSSITNLPTDAGYTYQVYGLNATGQLTGYLYVPATPMPHAFLYGNGEVTDLGTLGGPVSEGLAINGAGVIAGDSYLSDFQFHAFLAQSNELVDLGTLGGTFSSPYALNDAGQVAGVSYISDNLAVRAFLYSDGVMTNLGTLGGDYSVAFAINGSGSVVGESTTTNGDTHAFLFAGEAMVDLGTLGGNYSSAFSLNDSGAVVGQSTSTNGQTHAFLYVSNVMTDLGTLGGSSSAAFTINRSGQVIGASSIANDAESHGYIYQGGVMTDLGTLGGTNSNPAALNDLGQIVGDFTLSNGVTHPFLWQKGRMIDLNTLLPENSGLELTNARFINNAGRIVGLSVYQGASQWYILDVVLGNQTPIAVAGPDQAIECGNSVTLDGTGSSDPDGDPLTFQWSASSTVLGATPTLSVSLPLGTNIVTLVVADPCGAASQTNVTVIVRDTTPPTGSCPGPFTASADSTGQASVPDVLPQVIASDNCTASNSLSVVQSPAAGTLVGLGSHPITVTVTDTSGNSSICSVTFTVSDTTPPVISTVPAPVSVSADANCQSTVPNVLPGVVATDNCTPANQLAMSQTPAAGTPVGSGQYTIAVKVADAAGNSSTAAVLFKVVDTTAPTIVSAPAQLAVSADANCQATIPSVITNIVATDNCTPANQLVMTQTPAAGTVVGTGQYTITVKVTDAAGNSSTAVVPLVVADTTPPTITSVPDPLTVPADANCQGAVPNVLTGIIATDNCSPQVTLAQSPAAGTLVGLGPHTVTVTATDAAGNNSSRSVLLTVVDTTAPAIASMPDSLTVSADANCQGVVPNVLDQVLATDNCSAQVTLTQKPAAGTVLTTGSYVITVTATDDTGNNSSATVGLTIANNTPPVIQSLTANPSVLTPPNGKLTPVTVSVVATANCDSAVVSKLVSITCSDPTSPGDMQITGELTALLSASKSSTGGDRIYTLTVKSTDAFGNSSTGAVTVTVPHDNSGKPALTLRANNRR